MIIPFQSLPSANILLTGATIFALELPSNPSEIRHALNGAVMQRILYPQASEELAVNPRYHFYSFHSAILPDDRAVAVYLPPQYVAEPTRRFPVFYLHDGQNLFDGTTSYIAGRTWNAQTTADELTLAGCIEPVILVGVANTGLRRMAEYTPTRDFKMGGGEGRSYARLLIEELKPFIDATYRTLVESTNTALGGSSLGGLITLHIGLEHPEIFGKLAVMSPSLWWNHRSILTLVANKKISTLPRIWLDMGTAEGARHLRDTDQLYSLLIQRGWKRGVDVTYLRDQDAAHDEVAWSNRLGSVLRYLFPTA